MTNLTVYLGYLVKINLVHFEVSQNEKPFLFLLQLESLLQLWLTLSLNTCSTGNEESGSDIFLFNASRMPTIPLNQGQDLSHCFIFSTAVLEPEELKLSCLIFFQNHIYSRYIFM